MIDVEYEDKKAAENRLNQPIKAPDSTVPSQEEPRETLGEYCKRLELPYTAGTAGPDLDIPRVVIPEGKYCIIRVDGRAFHTFTRPYKCKEQAFSADITNAMKAAVEALLNEFSPIVVYSQSDEITVVIDPAKIPFSGKCHKLNSIAASVATAAFNLYLGRNNLARTSKPAIFDARSYGVTREDVLKVLIWRQRDAIKNSISAVARTAYSHKMLEGKKSEDKIAMLEEKGIIWESFPHRCIYGMTAFRVPKMVSLDPDWLREQGTPETVIDQIVGEGCTAMRNVTEYPDLPRFDRIANLEQVIFEHAEPLYNLKGAQEALEKESTNEDI
jgi:tRNA(His) 5'-end guanylyltransferase